MFPNEVLSLIFSYADTQDVLVTYRRVHPQWHSAGNQQGCVFWRFSKAILPDDRIIGTRSYSVSLQGHRIETADLTKETLQEMILKMNAKEEVRKSWFNRTKGHLPEPKIPPYKQEKYVLGQEGRGTQLQMIQTKHSNQIAFLQRFAVGKESFLSLDLSSSHLQTGEYLGPKPDDCRLGGTRSMKNTLQEINLCGLAYLQHVSIRGMNALKTIHLPTSIVALDASSCSRLEAIQIPMIGVDKGKKLKLVSLNLNRCRSLHNLFGPTCHIEDAASKLQELDLSSGLQLSKEVTAKLVQSTTCLNSLSLRYIATDEILQGLASSVSARERLKLVDVAFSVQLSDKPVHGLIQKALNLQRLNLRGCKSISSECYNNTPIVLQQREQKQASIKPKQDQNATCNETRKEAGPTSCAKSPAASSTFKKRKGDNMFYFAPALEHEKKYTDRKRAKH